MGWGVGGGGVGGWVGGGGVGGGWGGWWVERWVGRVGRVGGWRVNARREAKMDTSHFSGVLVLPALLFCCFLFSPWEVGTFNKPKGKYHHILRVTLEFS